jgi:hypothetical protein
MNILSLLLFMAIFRYFNFKSLLHLNIKQFLFKNVENEGSTVNNRLAYYNSFILASTINYFAIFLVILFLAHPQINNRMLSTCPLIYFYASDEVIKFCRSPSFYWKGFFVLSFFITFSIISCIMQVGSYGFA